MSFWGSARLADDVPNLDVLFAKNISRSGESLRTVGFELKMIKALKGESPARQIEQGFRKRTNFSRQVNLEIWGYAATTEYHCDCRYADRAANRRCRKHRRDSRRTRSK